MATLNENEWMTPEEAARYLRRTERALAQLRYRGGGPRFTKAGGRILYRRGALVEWLDSHESDLTGGVA